jgi:hypothetical protein
MVHCTDGGAEQRCGRNCIASALYHIPFVLYFHADCILHQFHLVVKGGLLLVDRWLLMLGNAIKLFSALAKTVNVWRANARSIAFLWTEMVKDPIQAAKAFKLPPQCVAGRWGSLDSTAEHLLDRGQHNVATVLRKALVHDKPTKVKKKAAVPDPALDEDTLHEQSLYREKMSKWIEGTIRATSSPDFWVALELSQYLRAPLLHFYRMMLQLASTKGGSNQTAQPALVLATGGAADSLRELTELSDPEVLSEFVASLVHKCGADVSKMKLFLQMAFELADYNAAAFRRRIFVPVTRPDLLYLIHHSNSFNLHASMIETAARADSMCKRPNNYPYAYCDVAECST